MPKRPPRPRRDSRLGSKTTQDRLRPSSGERVQSTDLTIRGRSGRRPVQEPELLPVPDQGKPSEALALRSRPPLNAAERSRRKPLRKAKPKPQQSAWQVVLLQGISFSIGVGLLGGWLIQQWGSLLAPPPDVTAVAPVVRLPQAPPVLGEPIPSLQTTLEAIPLAEGLTYGAVLVDTATRQYVSVNGDQAFPAASTIKVPLLVAFLQAVDRGEVSLTEQLTMRDDLIAAEAGVLQYRPVGLQLPALEVATLMSVISDNTATNMVIDRLGGMEAVNQVFAQWGLSQTRIENWLPDLEGTNTTSPLDMVTLLSQVEQGHILSLRERDRLFAIMAETETRTLIPQGTAEPEARIINKTGDIGGLVGDVGMVDLPNGRRYIATILVQREIRNDLNANELVREVARRAHAHWRQ